MMSAGEATALMLLALAEGKGGEILVLKLGEPVNIMVLVDEVNRKIGRLAEVAVVGLGPGERLHERLIGNDEITLGCRHTV